MEQKRHKKHKNDQWRLAVKLQCAKICVGSVNIIGSTLNFHSRDCSSNLSGVEVFLLSFSGHVIYIRV